MAEEEISTNNFSNDKAMSLTRLQRIVTSSRSKGAKLKHKSEAASKSKAQGSRKGRHSGQLALMLQVPLDVFGEIAGHMAPLDLLHLARSTRGLRDLLMSRNSRPIWRSSLRTLGLPDCPVDINEPQLISLIFEKCCQGCGSPHVKKVDYGLRVQLCVECFAVNVIKGRKLAAAMDGVSLKDYNIYRLCYFHGASTTSELKSNSWPDVQLTRQKFFGPDFADAIQLYRSFVPGSDEQKKFVDKRKEHVRAIYEHAVAIEKWLKEMGSKTASEASLRARSRKTSILNKLRKLGFPDEDLDNSLFGSWRWDQLLMQPRELTDRIWQNILPELKGIIVERRTWLDVRARQHIWIGMKGFYKTFCTNWEQLEGRASIMAFQDLQQVPEAKSIVENAELESSIGEEQWRVIESVLPAAIRDLEIRVKKDCADLIISGRESAGLPPHSLFTEAAAGLADLVLAHASSFILSEDRLYASPSTFEDIVSERRTKTFHSNIMAWPAITKQCPKVLKVACALIRSLGFADNVTMAEMERFGKKFKCKCCSQAFRPIMTWKELVSHFRMKAFQIEHFENWTARLPDKRAIPTNSDRHDVNNHTDLAELDSVRTAANVNDGPVTDGTVA